MDDNERLQQDHEILLELLEDKRNRDRKDRIRTIITLFVAGIFLLGLLAVVPKVISMYKSYKQIVGYVEEMHRQVSNAFSTYGATLQKVGDVFNTYSSTFEEIAKIDFKGIEETLKNAEKMFKAVGSLFGL